MQIELASLESSKGQFAHTYEPGELKLLDDRLSLRGPLKISGKVRRDGGKLRVVGHLGAQVAVECDRCLQLLDLAISRKFNLEYVTRAEYEALQVVELTDEDLDLSVFDGEMIDVDEIVGEQLELAVPSQTICRETCKGFCGMCGVNLNLGKCSCQHSEVDPRWAELKKLVNRKS